MFEDVEVSAIRSSVLGRVVRLEVKPTLLISVPLFRLLEVPVSAVDGFTLDAVTVCDLTTSVLLSMLFEVCW